jgi:hypothetical protein
MTYLSVNDAPLLVEKNWAVSNLSLTLPARISVPSTHVNSGSWNTPTCAEMLVLDSHEEPLEFEDFLSHVLDTAASLLITRNLDSPGSHVIVASLEASVSPFTKETFPQLCPLSDDFHNMFTALPDRIAPFFVTE